MRVNKNSMNTIKRLLRLEKAKPFPNASGSTIWRLNGPDGLIHRDYGPAKEINGNKEWFKKGKLHRKDGPAVEWSDGSYFWFLDGKGHRLDGPAHKVVNGEIRYFIDGEEFSESDYWKEVEKIKPGTRK